MSIYFVRRMLRQKIFCIVELYGFNYWQVKAHLGVGADHAKIEQVRCLKDEVLAI